MTVNISITLEPDRGPLAPQLDDALAALGFARRVMSDFAVYASPCANAADAASAPDIYKAGAEALMRSSEEATKTAEPEEPKRRGRPPKAAPAARNEPPVAAPDPAPEDDEVMQAQDAADEAAEVETKRDPDKPLTPDDIRAVMTEYQQNYGMPAIQADGAKLMIDALGPPPAGEKGWRVSLIPADQESYRKVVAAWRKAVDTNPFARPKV